MCPQAFFDFEPATKKDFVLPSCSVPYRRELFVGRGVSIYFDCQSPARWDEHAHCRLELLLLGEEADCELAWRRSDGTWCKRELHGRQICVIPAGTVHTCHWRKTADMILAFVELPFDVSKRGDVAVYDFAALAGHDLVIHNLVATLQRLCRQSVPPSKVYVESLGTVLAAHLMKAHLAASHRGSSANENGGSGLSPSQLDRVVVYIGKHLKDGISVAALAREAGVSHYYFSRLFKQSTGLPPHCYVRQYRLLKVKELLGTREFRVAEAAYETGFCDQSHLTREFRKFFGVTPAALIRREYISQQSPKLWHGRSRNAEGKLV